ncbi:recombinase family protein [Candidatus Methanomassiliicoccus intestinalis]|uniref:recombinase family protein n=1 Tax=Candidatus Methanomassiliicoccus intestinalis TaxID=1406512 RepID=UPI0037DDD1B7
MSSDSLRVALYARVSTKEQDTAHQIDRLQEEATLRGWQIVGTFVDHGVSGKNDNRPQWQAMLKLAGIEKNRTTRSKIDAIVVTKLDRVMRSLTHLENTINLLDNQRVGIICVDQGINTGSEDMSQRLIRQILGAVAEWEREMIVTRVDDGIEKAIVHGTKSGRPFGRPKTELPAECISDIERGMSLRKASAKYNIPLSTLSDRMKNRDRRKRCTQNIPPKNDALLIYENAKSRECANLKDCEQFSNEGKEQSCHKI